MPFKQCGTQMSTQAHLVNDACCWQGHKRPTCFSCDPDPTHWLDVMSSRCVQHVLSADLRVDSIVLGWNESTLRPAAGTAIVQLQSLQLLLKAAEERRLPEDLHTL